MIKLRVSIVILVGVFIISTFLLPSKLVSSSDKIIQTIENSGVNLNNDETDSEDNKETEEEIELPVLLIDRVGAICNTLARNIDEFDAINKICIMSLFDETLSNLKITSLESMDEDSKTVLEASVVCIEAFIEDRGEEAFISTIVSGGYESGEIEIMEKTQDFLNLLWLYVS